MSDYLPLEVWTEILARLPVKTVLQLRSVCKLFHSLISNPLFIKTHLACQPRPNPPTLFLRRNHHQTEYYTLFNQKTYFGTQNLQLDFPFKTKSNCHFTIIGTCNGVICLSDYHNSSGYGIILWNPSIKKYISLPKPGVNRRTHGSYSSVLGFGYDCKRNDHKVVRVSYVKGRRGLDLIPPEVEVYSVSSGSSRSFVSGAPPYGIYGYPWRQAMVNGIVHWIGYDPCVKKGNENSAVIVSFHVGDEMFGVVRLPEELGECGWDLTVAEVEGKLGLLHDKSSRRKQFCAVWVMEEYGVVASWKERYAVPLKEGLYKLIGFMGNGEVLGVTLRGKLVSYNPMTLTSKGLGIRGAIDAFHMDIYMESLVLLFEGQSVISGSEAITCEGEEEEGEAHSWPASSSSSAGLESRGKLETKPFGAIPEEELSKYLCVNHNENAVACQDRVKEITDKFGRWDIEL